MKKINKKVVSEYKKSIPIEVRVLFGKFYLYAFCLIVFFLLLYPLIVLKYCSFIMSLFLFILLGIFFVYMVIDVLRKRKNFNSSLFYILILVFVISYIGAIVEFLKFY